MKILMIGNGFDLEHGLPTKYTQFLDFVDEYEILNNTGQIDEVKNEYVKSLVNDCMTEQRCALRLLLEYNVWVIYFRKVRKEHLNNKKNWIDFEKEIRNIVEKLDALEKCYEGNEKESSITKERLKDELKYIFPAIYEREFSVEQGIEKLIFDLNRLIGALEIYIFDYIGKYQIMYYNPDIFELRPDKILSFNYSNTYKNLYDKNILEIEYSYIHGRAENHFSYLTNSNIFLTDKKKFIKDIFEKCNMVLGIEEYLPKDRRDKETRFIEFKKYYQRIYKKNGNIYKKWLNEIKSAGITEDNTLYIFGHSLDETDKDILQEFIMCNGLKTVIFYRNKQQLGEQIANLLKVIGYDALLEKVYGEDASIEFRQQQERRKIKNSEFEIITDICKIKRFYIYSTTEMEQVIAKIDNKIATEDIGYFMSCEMVITLYDELQKNGLDDKYKEKLKHIIYKICERDGVNVIEKCQPEMWAYVEYDRKKPRCDSATRTFIKEIKEYNNKPIKKKSEPEEDDWFLTCRRIIEQKQNISLLNYKNILEEGFYLLDKKTYKHSDIWNTLTKLSVFVGRNRDLSPIFEEYNNNVDRMRIRYLQKQIDIMEYLNISVR